VDGKLFRVRHAVSQPFIWRQPHPA
jgi:hypothetical protein